MLSALTLNTVVLPLRSTKASQCIETTLRAAAKGSLTRTSVPGAMACYGVKRTSNKRELLMLAGTIECTTAMLDCWFSNT